MTSEPWSQPGPAGGAEAAAPASYDAPVSYGPVPAGWGAPPGAVPGPVGTVRSTGKAILLFFVTLSIYGYVYNYKVHSEMKAHSGRGVGGGIALLLTFVAGIAMVFVTPSEVGGLYARRGEREPVRGWTGLWALLPGVGGYVLFIVGAVTLGATSPTGEPSDAAAVTFGVFAIGWLVAAVAGAVVWFVKTNGALNRYWQSVGAR